MNLINFVRWVHSEKAFDENADGKGKNRVKFLYPKQALLSVFDFKDM